MFTIENKYNKNEIEINIKTDDVAIVRILEDGIKREIEKLTHRLSNSNFAEEEKIIIKDKIKKYKNYLQNF